MLIEKLNEFGYIESIEGLSLNYNRKEDYLDKENRILR